MGSIRFIIFAVLIWLVWRMVQKFIAEQKAKSSKKVKKVSSEPMVVCQFCSTHLPQKEALNNKQQWFCNEQHRLSFLNDKHNEE